MIGATNGSTVNMLPLDGVERASILIPPPNKFREFENMAQNVQEKKESNQAQIKKLETLRDTLLPKLMNGAVKVKTN
jgi:type I restriction enzyme S subunit